MKKNMILFLLVVNTLMGVAQNKEQVSENLKVVDTTTVNEGKHKILEDVSVNGLKKNTNRYVSVLGKAGIMSFDLPQSVSVIDENILLNQQALRLSDAIKNVNGVYLGTSRGSTQEFFYARGYSLGNNNFFKNGARVNINLFPEMSSLEHIEVLKGSAAILYGDVAPGAVINMVTKKPKFDFGGRTSLYAGTYDAYRGTVDVYGPLSKKVAYRLNGVYDNSSNFRNNVSSLRYYINPSVLFQFTDKTSLTIQGDYLYNRFTPDFGIGTVKGAVSPLARNVFLGTPWQYSINNQATVNAEFNHKINEKWSIFSIASYQAYDKDYFSIERTREDDAPKVSGDWSRPLGKSLTEEKYYSFQFNIKGNLKTGIVKHNLLIGVDQDYTITNAKSYSFPNEKFIKGTSYYAYDVVNLLNPVISRDDMPIAKDSLLQTTPIKKSGVYIQNLISFDTDNFLSKFKLLLGIRWSYINNQAISNTYLPSVTTTVSASDVINKAFSPRVGLVFQPIPTMSIFASYANSFVANAGRDVYNSPLFASLIDQYEVGIKKNLFGENLSLNITAYIIKNNNLVQQAQFRADGVTLNNDKQVKELSGSTISKGIEIDIEGHPIKGLDIIAGVSYNDYRYDKTNNSPTSYIAGDRIVNTPQVTANGTIFYTLPQGLKFGITTLWIGDRVAGWNNTNENVAKNTLRSFNLKGFFTIDATIGYTIKHFSITAKMSNLTNTYNYYVHENYSVNPIAPRRFEATFAYTF